MCAVQVLRYAAFVDPRVEAGGNPAGLVLDARGLREARMRRIAADVGYSETAFLFPAQDGAPAVRYFSPRAEVPFCGHATIALAAALAERDGPGEWTLRTRAGEVAVRAQRTAAGLSATLVSVEPTIEALPPTLLARLLAALRIAPELLDPALPPAVADAGSRHPVIALAHAADLDALDYDARALGPLMAAQRWTTTQVVHRAGRAAFEARDPFPPGGIREDPATGSAAAALGGYLRRLGAAPPPARVEIRQGRHVGRPSLLVVDVPVAGGIAVSGHVRAIV